MANPFPPAAASSSSSSTTKKTKTRLSTTTLVLGGVFCVYVASMNIWFSVTNTVENSIPTDQNGAPPTANSLKLEHTNSSLPVASRRSKTKLGLTRDPGDPQPPRHGPVQFESYYSYNRLLVIPEYKLLFCYIEKVGCSMFNQLFRLLRLYHPSISAEERRFLAESHFGRATHKHFEMTRKNLRQLIDGDEWTKAVFFRDPADRFLSGFRSKCGHADVDGSWHCRDTFGWNIDKKPLLDGGIVSFRQSIDIAVNTTESVFANSHFKPSAHFCGGLKTTIDRYSFVHMLDRKTVGGHIQTLFDHIGVDKELTAGLLDRVVETGGVLHPVDFQRVQDEYGLRIRGNITVGHNTANAKISTKDYFQSPETLKKLQKLYSADYTIFQLQPPGFDEL